MTEQSNAELVAVARNLIDQYDPAFAHVLKQVTDRLEAADQEIQRQRGINRRAERQTQAEERRSAEYAAVVEKVRHAVGPTVIYVPDEDDRDPDEESAYIEGGEHAKLAVRNVLATAPADALRELKADVWDEAIAHVETFLGAKIKRAAHTDNPYREEQS